LLPDVYDRHFLVGLFSTWRLALSFLGLPAPTTRLTHLSSASLNRVPTRPAVLRPLETPRLSVGRRRRSLLGFASHGTLIPRPPCPNNAAHPPIVGLTQSRADATCGPCSASPRTARSFLGLLAPTTRLTHLSSASLNRVPTRPAVL